MRRGLGRVTGRYSPKRVWRRVARSLEDVWCAVGRCPRAVRFDRPLCSVRIVRAAVTATHFVRAPMQRVRTLGAAAHVALSFEIRARYVRLVGV